MMKPILKSGVEGFAEVTVGILALSIFGLFSGGFMPLETVVTTIVIVALGNMLYDSLKLKIANTFWQHITRVVLGGIISYFIFVMVVAFLWLWKPELLSVSINNWVDDPTINLVFDMVALVLVGMGLGALFGLFGREMIAKFVLFRERGETAVSIENKGTMLLIAPLFGLLLFSDHYQSLDLFPAIIRSVLGTLWAGVLFMRLKPKEADHDEDGDTNLEGGMNHEHNL